MNINRCLRCEERERPCAGPCACTVDGRDILDHAAAGDCPREKFSEPDALTVNRSRGTMPISADYDPATAKRGGCCDPPKQSE